MRRAILRLTCSTHEEDLLRTGHSPTETLLTFSGKVRPPLPPSPSLPERMFPHEAPALTLSSQPRMVS